MNVIEAETELFDLFGETGTCAICYEDLQDGERVRAIRKCQHLFHTTCIDPWLLRKAECPMCRTQLGARPLRQIDISGAAAASNTLRTILNASNGYPANSITALSDLLNTIETLIQTRSTGQNTATSASATTVNTLAEPASLQRYVVGFCLADGILRRFPTADMFRAVRGSLHTTVDSYECQGVRGMPLDFSNRTSLQDNTRSYRAEILRRLNVGPRVHIYNQASVAAVYDHMRGSAVLSSIWSAT